MSRWPPAPPSPEELKAQQRQRYLDGMLSGAADVLVNATALGMDTEAQDALKLQLKLVQLGAKAQR